MLQSIPRTQTTDGPVRAVDKTAPSSRLDSIDLLRGVVMVIMALDHCRGYFSNFHGNPVDLEKTTTALFLTRFITHYCAPTFVFLAGTGAFLFGTRGRSTRQLSWFLLSRGLWLVILELTLVRWGWTFELSVHEAGAGVLWAIGWSMVALSVLVFLPVSAITVFGIVMIAYHNLFDKVLAADMGPYGWLWSILHSGEPIKGQYGGLWSVLSPVDQFFIQHLGWGKAFDPTDGFFFGPGYPLIPWIGVLAVGYGFGTMFLLEPQTRRRQLWGLGLSLILTFVLLRYTNLYGDRNQWAPQDTWWFTVFSFINCHKYPPSLMYLLMTLGPSITALALFEHWRGWTAKFFLAFGRVPLFFYLLHIPLIHGLAVAASRYHDKLTFLPNSVGEGTKFDLPVVYLVWVVVVLVLFPLCAWFAGVKQRHKSVWLSYL